MSDLVAMAPTEGITRCVSAFEAFDDALAALYAEHAKALVEMLWVFVGDRAEAEDLCQEAFIRLHRAWTRIDHDVNVGAYLRTTAFNLARSHFRHQLVARRHRPALATEVAGADESVMLRVDQMELMTALRDLSRRQRECVVLRYWEHRTDNEIATTLGLSPNSVKTHLRRAMDNLEHHLKGH